MKCWLVTATSKIAEGFHEAVFQEIQQRGNRLTNEDSIRRLFERFGVAALTPVRQDLGFVRGRSEDARCPGPGPPL